MEINFSKFSFVLKLKMENTLIGGKRQKDIRVFLYNSGFQICNFILVSSNM